MKTLTRIVLTLSIIAFALCSAESAAFAQSPSGVVANIPFDFIVGGMTIPAGEYLVVSNDSGITLTVQQVGGSHRTTVAARMGRSMDVSATPKLLFNRYGDRYFLSQVITANSESVYKLPHSKAEMALAHWRPNPNVTTIIAQGK